MLVRHQPFLPDAVLRWLETILVERFGIDLHLSRTGEGILLTTAGAEGHLLFDRFEPAFTEAASALRFTRWDARKEGWQPVLGSPLPAPTNVDLPAPLVELRGSEHVIHYDLLGLIYWMLTRTEEMETRALDVHQRFPAGASHALRHQYLDRPIVDEWLHLLGQVIQRQWPGIVLKQHRFRMLVSHDVDNPGRYAFASWQNVLRRMAGDIARRKWGAAGSGPWVKLASRSSIHSSDPYNTFAWIMDQSEQRGLRSAFYFICGRTSPLDGEYDIGHPAIRALIREIHARGHEVGLHPSYNTFDDPMSLKAEADTLRQLCKEESVKQDAWGGRMHYLRWRHPETQRAWAAAGLDYDSTLGYADHAGFRCGTCFEYPAFDPVRVEPLTIRVRPLIAMEVTVFNRKYMGLDDAAALGAFERLKRACQAVGGSFTLLWHNSELTRRKGLYQQVLDL